MTSSTVTFSKSRMLSNICWWDDGIIELASLTMVLSSSELSASPRDRELGFTPNNRIMLLVIKLMKAINGYITRSSGLITNDGGVAMRSGWSAAIVFGVTSANTNTMSVIPKVAMIIPASPNQRKHKMVAIADAAILTKLLP